jgi:Na+:H+ antiporter, NhaA family
LISSFRRFIASESAVGASLPAGASQRQFFGVCVLCGIGFTMSLFTGGLDFAGHDPSHDLQVKLGVLGVLGGSLIASVLGSALLPSSGRGRRCSRAPRAV